MADSLSLNLKQKQAPHQKQLQRLMMLPKMQQAIQLLQAPILELSDMIEAEVAKNPLLEYSEAGNESDEGSNDAHREQELNLQEELPAEREIAFDHHDLDILHRLDEEFRENMQDDQSYHPKKTLAEEKNQSYLESSIQVRTSLFEHLMQQARLTFSDPHQLQLAEAIIGNFDEKGFLSTPLQEIAILEHTTEADLAVLLKSIQTFEPQGVGAANIQESYLIQLRNLNRQNSMEYTMLENHYEDLLHNRISLIQGHLKCSLESIGEAMGRISKLDLSPGGSFSMQWVHNIVPDIQLRLEGDILSTEINAETMPQLRFNPRYMRMLESDEISCEAKEFIHQKILSARWFLHNILQRNDTLLRIAISLARQQKDFFLSPTGTLAPLTMQAMAEELQVHESTIARAVSNKYIETPRGIFPLRYFFTHAYVSEQGQDVSATTVRGLVQEIIQGENNKAPFSDEDISRLLEKKGIACARRTVAKYRQALKIGNAFQRRSYEARTAIGLISPKDVL